MRVSLVAPAVLTIISFAFAQAPPTPAATGANEAAAAPATQPAGIDEPFEATAVKVVGNVLYALAGPDGKPGEFKPVKEGDKLPAGAIIQTRLRSKVLLAFGPDTVVLVDRVTMASIDQFHRSGDTKKIQLGLGHGLVRAAAVETTLRSDMTISSPVATLSKRGTMDFGMRYEPGTGRYVVFLNEEGLIELIDWLHDVTRTIEPGQYVTQALMTWIETRTLDRYIPVTDRWGLTASEYRFMAYFGSQGLGVIDPGAGANNYLTKYNPTNRPAPGGQVLSVPPVVIPPGTGGPLQLIRPEGNFGTGLGR
jgi:hypothetical protein